LTLAPKSKVHIRGLISAIWDFAIWLEVIPPQQNPMSLVRIPGASKRVRRPRSLSVEQYRKFAQNIPEPFQTIVVVSVCLGLRISECLALKWCDVDWLNGILRIERSIVAQKVDSTKTEESARDLPIDRSLLERLKTWKQMTAFSEPQDWIFASPVQFGRLPWSYDQIWRVYQKAALQAEVGKVGTRTLRHTFRSWLDALGTAFGVQKNLMRHTDIRTTFNVYGEAEPDRMRRVHGKVGKRAIPGVRIATDRTAC